MPEPRSPTFFPTAAEFGRWLAEHHAGEAELWVGYWKKATGRPSMTWAESVDEALCWGWIDGIRKSVDDDAYTIRFTPRRRGSNWSQVNLKRAAALIAEGRMRAPGLAAYEARRGDGSGRYSFERGDVRLTRAQEKLFRERPEAWAFWKAQPAGYRRIASWWVLSAKREETRARRLATLVEDSANGLRIKLLRRK